MSGYTSISIDLLLLFQAKHESTIGELEDKLRKDQTQKQELERTKRKIETELNDVKDQLNERKQQVLYF